MKKAKSMKIKESSKDKEPRKLKHGPKEKAERTIETKKHEKEGDRRVVKSKMKIKH